jgi:hypothetical protein
MPRGILKTASSRDKALPQIPSSPALVKVNTKLNAFRHGNDPVLLPSSSFHPEPRPASRGFSSRFDVNDSEDDNLWTFATSPCMVVCITLFGTSTSTHTTQGHVHTANKPHNTTRERPARSNRMRGKQSHSSRSSRASSVERRPRTRPLRKRGTRGHGSPVSSTAASRTSPLHSHSSQYLNHAVSRRYVEELKPVRALRLSTRKTPINDATATPKSSQLLSKNLGISSRQEQRVGSSPLLVSSTKSNLRRRPRVDKRGSISETDLFQDVLNVVAPTTESRRQRPSNCRPADLEATPEVGNRNFLRLSGAHKQLTSPVTIHSLPLILPAHAEYKCRVEWESDNATQSDSDEAGKLWRRLEQECGMSPTPPSLTHGLFHAKDGTFEDVELTPRRGRWKVKVVETPTIPPSVSIESSPRTTINSPFSEQKWGGEDFQFSESAMGFDNDSVTILREVSITELLPSLSAYTYLSSLLNKRTSSRHRHDRRGASRRRSSALRLTRSKTRLSRAEKSRHVVHRDVKRALCSFWEDCEDGWMDQEQVGGTVWSLHMAKLMSRSRSRRISKSSMGRALSGKRLDSGTSIWDVSSTNQEGGMTGLGIAMHRSVTLKSRAATTGADSIVDFYAAT